jgi:hypothetical protein
LFAATTVGSELIVTAVVFVPLHPLESVTMTVYMPVAAMVTELIDGL